MDSYAHVLKKIPVSPLSTIITARRSRPVGRTEERESQQHCSACLFIKHKGTQNMGTGSRVLPEAFYVRRFNHARRQPLEQSGTGLLLRDIWTLSSEGEPGIEPATFWRPDLLSRRRQTSIENITTEAIILSSPNNIYNILMI